MVWAMIECIALLCKVDNVLVQYVGHAGRYDWLLPNHDLMVIQQRTKIGDMYLSKIQFNQDIYIKTNFFHQLRKQS